jgi:GNAT superfamily N-acetyltransferase
MDQALQTDNQLAAKMLAAYDAQLRQWIPEVPQPGHSYETVGPVLRVFGGHRGFVDTAQDLGATGAALDAIIAEQVAFFAARGESFEWKTRGNDEPAELPDRLISAGFVPEERETVVVGEAAQMALAAPQATDTILSVGITIRQVTDRVDLERIAAMETSVWGEDWSWLADDLEGRLQTGTADILIAEAAGTVVSAAWLVTKPGRDFAGLWGGSTLAEWRGRGIYRALVARRAQIATERGIPYLQVDASDDSRPILERLGFVAITTTTPYVWTPPES